MSYKYFIGIDVGKYNLDIAVHDSAAKPRRYPNNSAGFDAIARDFADILPQSLVVMEATGGYETALISALLTQTGAAIHRAQPLKAAHYIRSLRSYAKTDALDAQALARYGAERHPDLVLFCAQEKAVLELQALQTRRDDLKAMCTAEKQRLKHPRYAMLSGDVQEIIDVLDKQIGEIEQRMEEIITAAKPLKQKYDLMIDINGIGKITAFGLIATMPELGQLNRKQIASLAGLAPHPKDSGKTHGYRATRGGRENVRRILFMAALAAKTHNPVFREFYNRLIQNGKNPLVALTALMRKIIVILNAKIRDEVFC
jgi:transposase